MKNLMKDVSDFLKLANHDLTNENANKDAKLVSSHRDLLAGILSKNYANEMIDESIMKWHNDGYGHIHDLDYFISPLTNCCLVNYPDMLENGFKMGNAKIDQPQSIGVACTVLTQIILAVASSQYGGQTMAHIDVHLEKYVQKSYDKLLQEQKEFNLPDSYVQSKIEKEVYDAMQTLLYQTNSLTSGNGQTPFITLTLGTSTTKFGRLITKQYLNVHRKGLGSDGTTPVFPKVVFFLEEGVNLNPDDVNYDLKQLAMETAAERIYPDFISVPLNKKITGSTSEPVSPMGCRSFLSSWKNKNGDEQYFGRLNLGVVSVSLPMIAYESSSKNEFFDNLDKHLNIAYMAHTYRINSLQIMKAKQNPIMFCEGVIARLNPEDTLYEIIKSQRCSASIGYVGLAECVEKFEGTYNKEFGLEILKFIKDKCNNFNVSYHDGIEIKNPVAYSPYGTPAESLCYRFAKKINEKYDNILGRDYLTNSFHYPAHEEIGIFDKWDFEEGFAELSNGGNISYGETPSLKNNIGALEQIINYAYYKIPYFGINQKVDKCFDCGFWGEFTAKMEGFTCPNCGNHDASRMDAIRRVSGYLGSAARPFNKGKQQEMINRKKHDGSK